MVKVAVCWIQAPPWRNGVLNINWTCVSVCARHMADKRGHVEVLCPASLWETKPCTDAVAVGTCWQVRDIDGLPLPFGTVMYDWENHEILWKYIFCLVLIQNGQRTATCVITCVGVDIVMPAKSVTMRFGSATPFLCLKNVIWIWWCISWSSWIWRWYCLDSDAHDNMCSTICWQSKGPCCIGLAINLPMHPPLRKWLSFHNWLQEPVYAILCIEVTCNLTFDINEGKVCTCTFRKHCDDDGEDCSHVKSRVQLLCGNAQKQFMTLWCWCHMMLLVAHQLPQACETQWGEDPATDFDVLPRFIRSARPNGKVALALVDHHR